MNPLSTFRLLTADVDESENCLFLKKCQLSTRLLDGKLLKGKHNFVNAGGGGARVNHIHFGGREIRFEYSIGLREKAKQIQ